MLDPLEFEFDSDPVYMMSLGIVCMNFHFVKDNSNASKLVSPKVCFEIEERAGQQNMTLAQTFTIFHRTSQIVPQTVSRHEFERRTDAT